MENLKFEVTAGGNGQIEGLKIGGGLILENSERLRKEFISVLNRLSNKIIITIAELDEFDLSCIQVIKAFVRILDNSKIAYSFEWNIDEDQFQLLDNVGLSSELFLNI